MTATKISIAAGVAIAAIATGIVLQVRTGAAPAASPLPTRETASATAQAESAQIADLRARLAAAEKRANAAESDTATLLQAISDFRAAPKAPPTTTQPRQTRDPATLSREEVLTEATAAVAKLEARVRAMPGYQPYQEPDETLISPEQRTRLEERRGRLKAKNGQLFVMFVDGAEHTAETTPIYDSDEMRKRMPQLTPADRKALDERWNLASAEMAFAQAVAKAAQKASPAK
jgi:hypothetical protein